MKLAKLLNIFVPLQAVSTRNLTSIGLVFVFFAVFWLAGGKIESKPKLEPGNSFGSVSNRNAESTIPSTINQGPSTINQGPAAQVRSSQAPGDTKTDRPESENERDSEAPPQAGADELGSLKARLDSIKNRSRR